MLGIIGAMDEEVAKLKNELVGVEVITKAGMDFYKGTMNGKDVVIVRSGVGKANAAICTQILADTFCVCGIINTGIAGSLDADIDIGDIVLATDSVQHDVDAAAFGYEPGVIPRMEISFFPADENMRKIAKECCEEVNSDIKVHEGRIVTGDQFISDKAKKKYLIETFGGLCTEMEGAGIAHAAYLNKIPYLIIRAISDKADDSAHVDYPEFEAKAIERAVILVKSIIDRI